VSEPLMTCRKRIGGIKTWVDSVPWDERGGYLFTAHAVPGMKAARAWFGLWHGTWEPVAPSVAVGLGFYPARLSKGESQAAATARDGVPMRGTGADRLVLAVKPGNAGGAKGTGCPGSVFGQPPLGGRSR